MHVGEVGLGEQGAALLVVRAVEADDERDGRLDLLEGLDEAARRVVELAKGGA